MSSMSHITRNITSYLKFLIALTSFLSLPVACTPSSEQLFSQGYPVQEQISSLHDVAYPVLYQNTEMQLLATMEAAPEPSVQQVATELAQMETRIAEATPIPTPTRLLGIINSGIEVEGLPPDSVEVENVWQGYVAGDFFRVYAGRLRPNYRAEVHPVETQYGALYIISYGPTDFFEELHTTADEGGPLKIVEYEGGYLILNSITTSEPYYFNLETLQFETTIP